MMRKLLLFFDRRKYKVSLFFLLSAASVICIALVLARVAYSNSTRYVGLIWNLFLAWIPFALAYLAYALSWQRKLVYFTIPAFALLWLIFFPNAPYILTDFQHLTEQAANVPVWFDVIMLIWFAWTGLMLGVISLYLMQNIIRREFGRTIGWLFVSVVSLLSSGGIYIGRFIRWNSWDIISSPFGFASELLNQAIDPSVRSIGFISLYTLFFLFVYITLYVFGHLLQEQSGTP